MLEGRAHSEAVLCWGLVMVGGSEWPCARAVRFMHTGCVVMAGRTADGSGSSSSRHLHQHGRKVCGIV